LDRRKDRWEALQNHLRKQLSEDEFATFTTLIHRHSAVEGIAESESIQIDWDATNNAKFDRSIRPPYRKHMTDGEIGCALSHAEIWKQVQELPLIIWEDDVRLYPTQKLPNLTFSHLLQQAWDILPQDWDLVYLGFCHAGPRPRPVVQTELLQIFVPNYGFYTHAYMIRPSAARRLLEQFPMTAPLDVWLADHRWFGLKVYCVAVQEPPPAVQSPPRYVSLIAQRRVDSNIKHSAHH